MSQDQKGSIFCRSRTVNSYQSLGKSIPHISKHSIGCYPLFNNYLNTTKFYFINLDITTKYEEKELP